MHLNRSPRLFGLATFISTISAGVSSPFLEERDPNSVCESFGIDFQDGGSYFINQASTEQFQAVSQFEGCNAANADVWFIPPSGDELTCSTVSTTPDDANEVTTCPVTKNQLTSGNYTLIIFGDNANGNQFSYQRDFQLNVGPQATVTVTPTITFNATQTPHSTVTSTKTQIVTSSANATTTFSLPATDCTKTVRPQATTTTMTKTITWNRNKYTHSVSMVYQTVTASCTIPPRQAHPDPTMSYIPRNFMPAAMKRKKWQKKAADSAPRVFKRAPDAPTVTIQHSPAVSVTSTFTGPTATDTSSLIVLQTVYTTLAPSTVPAGTATITTTLPTPLRTRLQFQYTTAVATKTELVTYTYTRITTPYAIKTACYKAGGNFGNGWKW